jgi:hypothetical protein
MHNKYGPIVCCNLCKSGLPDVIFSNQISQSGYILEGHVIENVRIFNGHLEYITAIWYTFYVHFGYLVVIWYIFVRFGILHQEKSGKPVANHPFLGKGDLI